MASKKLSKKQIVAKKRRQKRNAAQKIEFRKKLLLKSFADMRPNNGNVKPKVSFPADTFEFILAGERYSLKVTTRAKHDILFRLF